jgi:hypothetical protein
MLKAMDTISGQEATAIANIDDDIVELFFAKSVEATFNKEKVDVRTLGNRAKQKKTVGWEGTGSMSVYYVSSLFRELAIQYIKTGKDIYFDLVVTNKDDTSTIGSQTVALYDVNLDSTILAKFDTESQVMDESMNFSFTGAELLESFGVPENLQ